VTRVKRRSRRGSGLCTDPLAPRVAHRLPADTRQVSTGAQASAWPGDPALLVALASLPRVAQHVCAAGEKALRGQVGSSVSRGADGTLTLPAARAGGSAAGASGRGAHRGK
jgi:hypothetical protein